MSSTALIVILSLLSFNGPPTFSQAAEKIYEFKDVDTKAAIQERPFPQYTEEAIKKRTQGVVILSAVLSVTGHVTDVEVIKDLPGGLTSNAIKAANKIRFSPAQKTLSLCQCA